MSKVIQIAAAYDGDDSNTLFALTDDGEILVIQGGVGHSIYKGESPPEPEGAVTHANTCSHLDVDIDFKAQTCTCKDCGAAL